MEGQRWGWLHAHLSPFDTSKKKQGHKTPCAVKEMKSSLPHCLPVPLKSVLLLLGMRCQGQCHHHPHQPQSFCIVLATPHCHSNITSTISTSSAIVITLPATAATLAIALSIITMTI